MADVRLLEYRRKWEKRCDIVGLKSSAGGATEVSECIGFWRAPVDALLLRVGIIFGADISKQASGSVSKVNFKLYDRKDDGSGTTQVGSTIENTAALADDILHDFEAGGYKLAEGYVLGVERTETDYGTSNTAAVVAPTLVVEWIPYFAT